MSRRIPAADVLSGVRWPLDVDGVTDSGEGGLWVYALVRAASFPDDDPMVHCHGPDQTVTLPLPDVLVHDPGEVYAGPDPTDQPYDPPPPRVGNDEDLRRYRNAVEDRLNGLLDAGASVIAAVLLGSSGGSWFDERTREYWRPTRADLTPAGLAVVEALEALHQRPVHLTVYLDT